LYGGESYEALTCFDVSRSKPHGMFFEAASGMFISFRVFSYKQRFSRFCRLYCFSERQLLCYFITAPFRLLTQF